MTPETNNLVTGAKVLALALYLGLTIATCAGVWNGLQEPFAVWASILLLIINGAAVAWVFKRKIQQPAEKEKKEAKK